MDAIAQLLKKDLIIARPFDSDVDQGFFTSSDRAALLPVKIGRGRGVVSYYSVYRVADCLGQPKRTLLPDRNFEVDLSSIIDIRVVAAGQEMRIESNRTGQQIRYRSNYDNFEPVSRYSWCRVVQTHQGLRLSVLVPCPADQTSTPCSVVGSYVERNGRYGGEYFSFRNRNSASFIIEGIGKSELSSYEWLSDSKDEVSKFKNSKKYLKKRYKFRGERKKMSIELERARKSWVVLEEAVVDDYGQI